MSRPGPSAAFTMMLLFVCASAGCDVPRAQQERRAERLRFTSGLPGAGFHPLGQALGQAYAQALPDRRVDILESPGSVRNVQALQRGTADVGLAFADVAYVAYVGGLREQPQPFDQLRGIAALHLTPLHLLVRAGARVSTVADLRGLRVGTGPPGSGTAISSDILMRGYGIAAGEFVQASLPFTEAADRLAAGTLDAAFFNVDYPAEAVTQATRAGARLVPIDGPVVARLRREYPFLRRTFVPANTYAAQSAAVPTLGVDTLLVCRAGLDERIVYTLTKTLFERFAALARERVALQAVDLGRAPATPIPLHRGAARYYREQELSR